MANIVILPALDPAVSARSYAELLRNDLHPDRLFAFQLKRSWNYGLAFYFHRELPEWSPEDPKAALVLTDRAGFGKVEKAGRFQGELEQPRTRNLFCSDRTGAALVRGSRRRCAQVQQKEAYHLAFIVLAVIVGHMPSNPRGREPIVSAPEHARRGS